MNLLGLGLSPLLLQSWVPESALGWNAVGWSLSDEAFFYACFPFLGAWVARLGRSKVLQVATGVVAAGCVLPIIYVLTKPDGLERVDAFTTGPWLVALRFLPLQRLAEFLLGICVARLFMSHPQGRPALPRGMTGAVALTTLALFCLHDRLPFPLGPSLFSVLFAALLYGLPMARGLLPRVLASKPLHVLGEASYALYILHMPVLDLMQKMTARAGAELPLPVFVPLFLLVALGVSVAVFRFVEEPARRALRQWFERPVAHAHSGGDASGGTGAAPA
jgi:peptidoglycan/LPS O-acetylase OafA/YrhL